MYNQTTCPMRVQYSKDWGWREKRAVPTPSLLPTTTTIQKTGETSSAYTM